jgi:hypothetical protein
VKRPVFLALVFSTACYVSEARDCGTGPRPLPTPSPTAAPPVVIIVPGPGASPSATITPESCRIDYMVLSPENNVLPFGLEGVLERPGDPARRHRGRDHHSHPRRKSQ